MIGTFVNTATVIIGSTIGLFLGKKLHDRYAQIFFQAVGLFTIAIGVNMILKSQHMLLVIISLVIGSLIGEWVNLERKAELFGNRIKTKLKLGNDRFTEGLTASFLLFCIGSMTIMGAIQEGLGFTPEILLTKAVMDGFSSIVLASAFGIGVLFSAIPLLLFQGGLTLVVMLVGKQFSPEIIIELTTVGGVLLIGLGINILDIKKLRIINMLPSILFICLFVWLKITFWP